MREEEHKKRQWEEELVQKIREDRDSHIRDRIEKRQREREKEQEMMRLVKSQLKSVHRSIPIHEKWEKQYQVQFVLVLAPQIDNHTIFFSDYFPPIPPATLIFYLTCRSNTSFLSWKNENKS